MAMKGLSVRRIDESLTVVGSSAKAVMERVEISVRGLKGYTIARPSMDVAQIAYVVSKLLGSKTHVCTVSVSSDPRRLSVSIQGEIEESRADPLRAAIMGTSLEGLHHRDPGTFGPPTSSSAPTPPVFATSAPTQFVPQFQPAPTHRAPVIASAFVSVPPIGAPPGLLAPPPAARSFPAHPSTTPSPTVRAPAVSAVDDGAAGVVSPTPAWFLSASPQPPAPPTPSAPIPPSVAPTPPAPPPPPSGPHQAPARSDGNHFETNAVENSRTIVRPYGQNVPKRVDALVPGARPIVVEMSSGQRFELTARVLFGRNPVARADDGSAQLVAVQDAGVSKTHLAVGRSGDDAWLEDRGSTNGTTILNSVGELVVVTGTQRITLSLPATVIIGDTRVTISRS